MNSLQKSKLLKLDFGKVFRTAVPKWRGADATDIRLRQMAHWSLIIKKLESSSGSFSSIGPGKVLVRLPLALKNRGSSLQRERKDGIGKQLRSCYPMKNIQVVYSFRKRLAPALSKLKMMASQIGISTPTLMRPLFLMNCLGRCSKKSVTARKIRLQDFP